MKYPKLRELREALTSLFTPAYTTRFPYEPHIPFKNFRGKPVVNDVHCVGCETCANVCPSQAITFTDDIAHKTRTITRDFGRCIFCGQCEEHCITGQGVKLSDKIFDLAVFDRNEIIEVQHKELLICEACGAVITTREHFMFMNQKLGPKAYASMLNLQVLNERLKLASLEETPVEIREELTRKDFFNILCPNCLRKTLIKTSYNDK